MAQKELEFEQALQRLEAVVKKLEAGNVSLDEALAGYEEGISLVRFCNEKLDAAELRVDAVRMTEEGASIAPFDKE
ncbi:MAG: exodeoxyribonuclease VII small subunit [Clostridia bacterium]|nr:exodeoxyribonuclease VII small subunit [Clostridia bacterium]